MSISRRRKKCIVALGSLAAVLCFSAIWLLVYQPAAIDYAVADLPRTQGLDRILCKPWLTPIEKARLRHHLAGNDDVYVMVTDLRPDIIRWEDWTGILNASPPSRVPAALDMYWQRDLPFSLEDREDFVARYLKEPHYDLEKALVVLLGARLQFIGQHRKDIAAFLSGAACTKKVFLITSVVAVRTSMAEACGVDPEELAQREDRSDAVKAVCDYLLSLSDSDIEEYLAVDAAVESLDHFTFDEQPITRFLTPEPPAGASLIRLRHHLRREGFVYGEVVSSCPEIIRREDFIFAATQSGLHAAIATYAEDGFAFPIEEREEVLADMLRDPDSSPGRLETIVTAARDDFIRREAQTLAEIAVQMKSDGLVVQAWHVARRLHSGLNLAEAGIELVPEGRWPKMEQFIDTVCNRVLSQHLPASRSP